jgi:NADH-quinone oxidoreductase subunit J
MSIISAGLVVLIRDPVKAAMSLIVCFFCIACLYLLQSAELIAVLEVIVYAGAIMVLFVFVIMLVEHKDEAIVAHQLSQRVAVPLKILAALTVAASIVLFIHRGSVPLAGETLPPGFGSVRSVGREFFNAFLFHFEFTSLLLLVGIVGAVVISRRAVHRPPPLPQSIDADVDLDLDEGGPSENHTA